MKTLIAYVPHGINEKVYFPISNASPEYANLLKKKEQIFGQVDPDFVLFFNSRNIRRKMIPDLIVAFDMFLKSLPSEKSEKCYLILHTAPIDENGTNLFEVIKKLTSKKNIIISPEKISSEELNILYNLADATVSISSAEGWGLSNTESLMAGTMTITNTTGGLQDQSRFVDENNKWIDFTPDFPTNACKRYTKCGEWTLPIYPQANIVGSVPTPYIYDSRASIKDIMEQIQVCYDLGKEERNRRGLLGREWCLSEESNMSAKHMCENIIHCIDTTLEKFTPSKQFELINTKRKKENKLSGVYNPLTQIWH